MSKKKKSLYEFGEFQLNAQDKTLWREEELISLPPKVLDTLLILVEKQGNIVTKDEMLNEIWADTFVEENNLSQNIYTLRQVLGKDENGKNFIETIPRRGYRFSSPIRIVKSQISQNEAIATNGKKGIFLTEQTRTQIIEEEIIESSEKQADVAEFTEKTKKNYLVFAIGALSILSIGTFAFWFWSKNTSDTANSLSKETQFLTMLKSENVSSLAFSPKSKFVAFTSVGTDNKKTLYLKDLKLEQKVRLDIPNKVNPNSLKFSPNENYIYFLNEKEYQQPADIYKITRFGGQAELVAENVASEFSFSKDGKQIAFVRKDFDKNEHLLTIKNLENSKEKIILKKEFPDRFSDVAAPAWSPAGDKIYIVTDKPTFNNSGLLEFDLETSKERTIEISKKIKHIVQLETSLNENELFISARQNNKDAQVMIINPIDGLIKPITNDLNNYRKISVSEDGKRIIALERITTSNLWNHRKNLDSPKQLTTGRGRDGRKGLEILPDGRILFVSTASGNREIWALDLNDNTKTQLTRHSDNVSLFPSFSPIGQHIYYQSSIKGKMKIKRMDFDGRNKTQITSNKKSSDTLPAISPDNKKLYFIRQTKETSTIWQMDLPNGKPEKLNLPKKINPESFLRISPNGRFLAFRQARKKEKKQFNPNNKKKTATVGIVSIDGSFLEPKFFDLNLTNVEIRNILPSIRWTPTSDAFDFPDNDPNSSFIKRQSIFQDMPPKVMVELPKTKVRDFIWIPNTEDLLISNHIIQHKPVLITDFD